MPRPKVLITRQIDPIAEEILSESFEVIVNKLPRYLSKDELIKSLEGCFAVLSLIPDRIDSEVIENSKNLKAISNLAMGLDNVDTTYAQKKGVAVYNLADTVTESTADLTMALLLSFLRRICEAQEYVKQDKWNGWEPSLLLGEELRGKTLGIVGYGKIGRAVAKRAYGFGVKIVCCSRSAIKDLEPYCTQLDLDTLITTADYISIHTPLTEATKSLFNYDLFKKMKKSPVIVNMARGAVVDTESLVQALSEGLIRGAALDVTDPEPIRADHPLCHMKNCLIIPHIGSATTECRKEMARRAAQNIINHLKESLC